MRRRLKNIKQSKVLSLSRTKLTSTTLPKKYSKKTKKIVEELLGSDLGREILACLWVAPTFFGERREEIDKKCKKLIARWNKQKEIEKMRVVNCPYCEKAWNRSKRKHVPIGDCVFCHRRRKVNRAYVEWFKKTAKAREKAMEGVQKQADDLIKRGRESFEFQWNIDYPPPRKFPPKEK